jgi:hypothetical protein
MAAPRVLVSSVTSWNDAVGADTYSTLFAGHETDSLANLYIREETPNSQVCKRYFKISESRVIRSVLNRRIATGKELRGANLVPDEADVVAQQDTATRYKEHRRKRSWVLLYARETLWKLGRWKTPELDAFLDDFKPEVVLFGMEGYIHFNRINRYIIKRTGARAIGYFYDDNFTYKQHPWSPGYRIYRFFQRRDLKKTARRCSAFFAISPKMKAECDGFFGIESVLLTKPIEPCVDAWVPYTPGDPVRMLYTGNLLYGRLSTLYLLSDALEIVNADGVRLVLDVYTTTDLTEAETGPLDDAVRVHPAVPQGKVLVIQRQADVLLFMEDVVGSHRNVARLSFSTKITDYLAAGRAVFAVAGPDVAPLEYLKAEDAALCASSREEIARQLMRMAADPSVIVDYGRRAFECGQRNHDARAVKRCLYDTIGAVLNRTEPQLQSTHR